MAALSASAETGSFFPGADIRQIVARLPQEAHDAFESTVLFVENVRSDLHDDGWPDLLDRAFRSIENGPFVAVDVELDQPDGPDALVFQVVVQRPMGGGDTALFRRPLCLSWTPLWV